MSRLFHHNEEESDIPLPGQEESLDAPVRPLIRAVKWIILNAFFVFCILFIIMFIVDFFSHGGELTNPVVKAVTGFILKLSNWISEKTSKYFGAFQFQTS